MTRAEFEDMVERNSASDMEDIIQFMYECGYFDSSYNYEVVSGGDYAEWLFDEINSMNSSSAIDIWGLMKWLEDQPYPDETSYYCRSSCDGEYRVVGNRDYDEIINDLREWMDDRFDDDDDYDSYGDEDDEDDDENDCNVATMAMSYQTVLEQRADKQKTILSQIESLF